MKISYFCSDVDIRLFGHEGCSIHIREFTNALVEQGHDVLVVCADPGERTDATFLARLVELPSRGLEQLTATLLQQEPVICQHNLERDLRSILYNHMLMTQSAALLDQERPDFIYERYSLFGYAGTEMAYRRNLPLILELNAPLCSQQAGYDKFTLTETASKLESTILKEADAIIALTDWLKDWAVSLGVLPERVHVIPDAVADRLFTAPASPVAVRRKYHLEGKRVIGFVGSFHPWHDIAGLLKAFKRLAALDSSLVLLLVGQGDSRRDLEQQAQTMGIGSQVIFTGSVDHEAVPSFIAAMDVAVVPYRQIEDFFFSPLKLFEYMAVGTPTIAAALGQLTQLIRHGETGWLYPPGDEARLAELLDTVLKEPRELVQSVALAGRKQVLSEHTWGIVARRVIAIAKKLIDQRLANS